MVPDLDDEKWFFLNEEFLTFSVRGALEHSGIYSSSKRSRKKLKEKLRESLRCYGSEYKSKVSPEAHIENIQKLADKLSQDPHHVLKDRFRIGVAQKALNLYLKYLWCVGRIYTPPHCPFDREILQKLKPQNSNMNENWNENWTSSDDIEEYKLWAKEATSKTRSPSEWELRFYNEKKHSEIGR